MFLILVVKINCLLVDMMSSVPSQTSEIGDKLDSLEKAVSSVSKTNIFIQSFTLLLVAGIGAYMTRYQLKHNKEQRDNELLIESLKWFEGRAQTRSIGISLVESKWQAKSDFRTRWISVLVNQAILLLSRKDPLGLIHDKANLYRIMSFLMSKSSFVKGLDRTLLSNTLKEYPDGERGETGISDELLLTWKTEFSETNDLYSMKESLTDLDRQKLQKLKAKKEKKTEKKCKK